MGLAAVILAAGKGTRMKSDLPKVLHKVCGMPMVRHVLHAARESGSGSMVLVVGFGGELVEQEMKGEAEVVFQYEQLGTAHALMQSFQVLQSFTGDILVLCGDTPLVTTDTLKRLVMSHRENGAWATVLTAKMEDPSGYGRIIRDSGDKLSRIVEQKDATTGEMLINEVNTGIYCFKSEGLYEALTLLKPDNAQGEYYLPDIIEYYVREGRVVSAVSEADPVEIMGINDRFQLALAQNTMGQRIKRQVLMSGVTMMDPDTVYIDAGVIIGRDTTIYPNTMIEGQTTIGQGCSIGPFTQLISARIGDNVTVRQSIIEDSQTGNDCLIGPYSYIRPGCVLDNQVKVGDFVELKKVTIGQGSKVPHLSYVGDAVLGQRVNVGAGTITCNFDGEKKWNTTIEDNAFIGSNTNLVAPVRVGTGAVIAAGSTITKDVPEGALGVAREKQTNLPGWSSRAKNNEKK